MLKKFYYSIEGFEPRDDLTLGRYGFSIYLDKEFAKRALEKQLPEAGYNNMIDMAKTIIIAERLEKRKDMIYTPYSFISTEKGLTYLFQSCTVPGNACDLGASWDEIESIPNELYKNYIEYHPHNVDNSSQAHALLSIWLMWQRLVESFIEKPDT